MNRIFVRNDAAYRLLRTIIQGVIGVLIANIDIIVGFAEFSPEVKAIIVALVMAILSPVMASMGTYEMQKQDISHGHFEDESFGSFKEGENNDDSK